MAARSKTKTKTTASTRAARSKSAAAKKPKAPARDVTPSDNDDYGDNGASDAYQDEEREELDSDAFDDDEDFTATKKRKRASPTKKAKAGAKKASPRKKALDEDEDADNDGASDAYQDEEREELDSDALDDDEDFTATKKRKRASPAKKAKAGAKNASPRKRRKKAIDKDDDEDSELEDGMEVVGVVVQAPKTGRVPPGQVSHNTFNFLSQLRKPECNDREWFKLHEPVYRVAEKEWKDFVDKFTDVLTEEDPQIPPLPPKDVIHRIYRDIRFSNDKTPYKTGFSASFSRSGRKGIFAAYHISVSPGNQSLIAAGSWCPGKNELSTIREHIKHNSSRLRTLLAEPDFVSCFGAPKPGKRQSVFGMEDELKVAPKGVDKNHKDIDLLKCRSFAVVHRFADEEVLAPGFMDELRRIVGVARPLVYCLNDYMTLGLDEGEEADGGEEVEEDEGSGDEEGA